MDVSRVYADFIASRRCREDSLSVFERHHIRPKCLKGSNEPDNLIKLSPEEHLFAHILLAKMHGGVLAVSVVRMLGMRKYAGRRSRLRYADLRRKHREALQGKKMSPEACKKIGDGHRGKIVSAETWAKLSAARKLQVITPEHAAAISRGNMGKTLGRKLSASTREKLSRAMKGKQTRLGAVLSDETKDKMRRAALRRHRGD